MFTGAQIFSLICLALIQQSSGQTDRFIVDVVSFTPPNHSPRILRCSGTVITPQHILTTASCASVSDSTQSLAIHVPTSSDSSVEGGKIDLIDNLMIFTLANDFQLQSLQEESSFIQIMIKISTETLTLQSFK